MASIRPVKLTITVAGGSAPSRVCVTYTIAFSADDIAGNNRYRELMQLFSQDPPAGPAGDTLLFTFFPSRVVRPNGAQTVQRTVCVPVPNSVLNEDSGGLQDEIYAKVCLTPLDPPFTSAIPPCRDSGVVSV